MKKIIRNKFISLILGQIALLVLLGAFNIKALITDKTLFAHRPQNDNLTLELMMQNKKLPELQTKEQIILQATPFVELSQNRSKFIQYLTFDNKISLNVGRNTDIDNRYLKFDETSTTNLTGSITLKPKIETYGIFLSYFQPLKKIFRNLFLKANIPLVQVRSNPELRIKNGTISSADGKKIEDYFGGQAMVQGKRSDEDFYRTLQDKLEFGKISNYTRKKTSVADINLILGYKKEVEKDNFWVNFNALLTIPTNSSPRAEWLLEPIIGTAGHWALGVGVDGCYAFRHNVEIIFDLQYKHLLNANEKRILGLNDRIGKKLKWGQYTLLGRLDSSKVLPAANILAQEIDVSPRGRIEGLFMFAYNNKQFSLQLGYNLWIKQKDNITGVRNWENNRYAFVGSSYLNDLIKILADGDDSVLHQQSTFKLEHSNLNNTIGTMNSAGININHQGTISDTQLNFETAETPSVISHKIFVAWEKIWEDNPISYFLGTGASIEFPSNNARLQQMCFWLKGGLLF